MEHNYDKIIGRSVLLKNVLFKVEQIAATNTPVLILGETGTGKELIARAIHARSSRQDQPFVKVICANLSADLIENALFGHERDVFTNAQTGQMGRFQLAAGATIFWDEIGELSLDLQSMLLRVLQKGEFERLGSSRTLKVNVRIIATTNRNLAEDVRRGHFRKDLWHRLNFFPITVPPLRQRTEDIALLVNFFANKFAMRLGKQIQIVPPKLMKALQEYPWPGNVRELENVIERAVINSRDPKLRLGDKLDTLHAKVLAKNQ